jgi:hypothetical protein
MPSQLPLAGSQSAKPTRNVALWNSRFIQGLITNRNPLKDGVLPAITAKFYGELNDALLMPSLNCEITVGATLKRRPGSTVFDSNTFGPIQNYGSYPVFGVNGTSYQRVLAATATQVIDVTGGGDTVLYSKATGAGLTTFQAVNDTMFFADGSNVKQLISVSEVWAADTDFPSGTQILDTNGNIQTNLGLALTITNIAITAPSGFEPYGTLTVSTSGTPLFGAGQTVSLIGLTTATFLNGQSFLIKTVGVNEFTANISVANAYTSAADTGIAYLNTAVNTVTIALNEASITSGGTTLTIRYYGNRLAVGSVVEFSGIVNPTYEFLNGTSVTVATSIAHGQNANFTATVAYSVIAEETITGGVGTISTTSETGATEPTWNSAYEGTTTDGTTAWLLSGSAVLNVGIVAPTTAPIVSNTPAAPIGNAWAASTYFFPGQVIEATVSTTVTVQQLTTAGTTTTAPPTFSTVVGATTVDGSATWTCVASGAAGSTSAVRAVTTEYAIGQFIIASWSQTIIVGYTPGSGQPIYSTISYSAFFQCTTAGTTSDATALVWPLSGTFSDGTVVWTFIGLEVQRANTSGSTSPSISASTFASGTIGNSTLVSLAGSPTTITAGTGYGVLNDAVSPGDGVGNFEQINTAGLSGSTHPTWPLAVGSTGQTTIDSEAQWISQGSAGSAANTGYWFYAYSYESSLVPDTSAPSPISLPIILAANSYISVSGAGDPNMAMDGVNQIAIYRSTQQPTTTVPSTSELFLIATIPAPANGAAWNFIDSSQDPPAPGSTLNDLIPANTDLNSINTAPPTNLTNLVVHLSRLWGSVGNTLYASLGPDANAPAGQNGYTNFSADNFIDFPSTINRLYSTSQGLFVFTASGLWVVSGNGVAAFAGESGFTTFIPTLYADNIWLTNYLCFAAFAGTFFVYTADRLVQSITPSGTSPLSMPIADLLQAQFTLPDGTNVNFNPANTYLTWYSFGTDFGLFISDGSTGYFRLMPAAGPDATTNPYIWSAYAEIVGGVSAVQSVETEVGFHQLLMGPKTSGPILYRDTTNPQDNGIGFSWQATIGALLLAHPNESAWLKGVTVDYARVGSPVQIKMWYDEINTNNANGVLYTHYVTDPYETPDSASIYRHRFFFSDNEEEAQVCRFCLMQLNFGPDDAFNEVYSASVVGLAEHEA